MLNICQVSLSRDIPLILENYLSFKKIYSSFSIFIICPKNEIDEFKKRLDFQEFVFISEETIISFEEFFEIFDTLSGPIDFKKKFEKRLGWYYQQILKLSFIIDFVSSKKKNIIIWDADTVLLKKIVFYHKDYSIKYGTLFEFHKPYYKTNTGIIGKNPEYFISSLVQFISITELECNYFMKNFLSINKDKDKISFVLSKIILKSIFENHKIYNGSLFSEYELLGTSNYLLKKEKQKPIFTLRSGLDGKLTSLQIKIAKLFNTKHVTYEHSHKNILSQGMLERNQSWKRYIKILFKDLIKFHLRNIKHNLYYYIK
jgi:hypothetical protein